MQVYLWRRHLDDTDAYWLTAGRTADVLRVKVTRLNQLVAADLVPYVVHSDGTRLYRREQLEGGDHGEGGEVALKGHR